MGRNRGAWGEGAHASPASMCSERNREGGVLQAPLFPCPERLLPMSFVYPNPIRKVWGRRKEKTKLANMHHKFPILVASHATPVQILTTWVSTLSLRKGLG